MNAEVFPCVFVPTPDTAIDASPKSSPQPPLPTPPHPFKTTSADHHLLQPQHLQHPTQKSNWYAQDLAVIVLHTLAPRADDTATGVADYLPFMGDFAVKLANGLLEIEQTASHDCLPTHSGGNHSQRNHGQRLN